MNDGYQNIYRIDSEIRHVHGGFYGNVEKTSGRDQRIGRDRDYPFRISGVSRGNLGVSTFNRAGKVYDLKG